MYQRLKDVIEETIKKEITNVDAAKKIGLSLSQFKRYKKEYRDNKFVFHHKGKGNSNAQKYTKFEVETYVQTYIAESISIVEKTDGKRNPRKIKVFNNNYNFKNGTSISYSTAKRILNDKNIISPISRFNEHSHLNIAIKNSKLKTKPGEEFQCDGSFGYSFPSENFEAVAHVIVDHATSTLVGCHFAKGETNDGYMNAFRYAFINFGLPLGTKSDGRTTFFNIQNPETLTVMGKILESLGISHTITKNCNSNNKVENAHDPVRDYIFDQMLIDGIQTMEEANSQMSKYMNDYNIMLKHSIPNENVLRCLSESEIDAKFITTQIRSLSRKYTIMINNIEYFAVLNNRILQRKSKTKLTICTTYSGDKYVLYGGNKYELIEATIKNLNNLDVIKGSIQKVIIRKNGIDFYCNKQFYHMVDSIGVPVRLEHRDVVALSIIENKITKARCSKGIFQAKAGKYEHNCSKVIIKKRKISYKQIITFEGNDLVLLDLNNERVIKKVGSEVELIIRDGEVLSAILEGKTYLVFNLTKNPKKFSVPNSKYAAKKMFGEC